MPFALVGPVGSTIYVLDAVQRPDSQPVLGYIGKEHLWSRIYDPNTKYSNDHELYTDGADG